MSKINLEVAESLDFEEGDSDHYDLASTITIAENQGFCVAIVMDSETSSNNFIFSKESNDQIQIENNSTFTIKTTLSLKSFIDTSLPRMSFALKS